ncbi:MAG: putative transposase [Yoonia sp.]|jgi:putative transposase
MKRYGRPHVIVSDLLRSYGAAMKVIGNADRQETGRWKNNRAKNSHLPFRRRERAHAALPPNAKFAKIRLRPRLG